MRHYILSLFLLPVLQVFGQQQPVAIDTSGRIATVNVFVTDKKAGPRKGEEILFRGEKSGKTFSGITDANGKFVQLLPPGDQYHVSVKSISDTTRYLILAVPSLEEDEYFTEPFWVNVKFDPPQKYRLDRVYFDVDKSSLRPDSYPELEELLLYLQRHEGIRVEIAGHTDNTGTPEHNLQLSQARAGSIVKYLTGKGISPARLQAKGYGAGQPVADNSTEKGKQLNRRTEVRIL
ncbi:MAG TPA: OmpA family protein [Chitinophagaceae bacterium]|nr:OmpA family protein [Chitinophagaceae bacterium]